MLLARHGHILRVGYCLSLRRHGRLPLPLLLRLWGEHLHAAPAPVPGSQMPEEAVRSTSRLHHPGETAFDRVNLCRRLRQGIGGSLESAIYLVKLLRDGRLGRRCLVHRVAGGAEG